MFKKRILSIRFPQDVSLHQWVWLAYVRAALIPLLFVELALLGVYMLSHEWSKTERIVAIQALASNELLRLVENHVDAIERQLDGVSQLTELLRQETQDALARPVEKDLELPNRYAMTKDGALYSRVNDGGAAVFFSGFVKINDSIKTKISQTSRLDATLRRIVDVNPLVVQAYFNSHDSLNRIWPYFDVLSQYPEKMDIPSYNFYYEADAEHNPDRKTLWIDAYLDPAGQGWMVSSISPVYKGDFLEGVVGLDITLDAIVKQVLALRLPWQGFAVLISKDGMLLALPERAEKLFNLHELTSHHYDQAIRQETFKPDAFNIHRRPDMRQLSEALTRDQQNNTTLVYFNEPYLLASKTLPSTGWRLAIFAPENEIFKPAKVLAARLTRIGWYILGGLFIFYLLFFGFLYQRAKRLSRDISDPLQGIQNMAIQIGDGNFQPDAPVFKVKEFKSTVNQMLLTADKLQYAEHQLIGAKEQAEQANYAKGAFLANMSHEIRTPLNAITGLAELAKNDNLDNTQKRYLNQIQQSSHSLLAIINDILDLSKIESGKVKLENTRFVIEEMLQGLADHFIRMIEHKRLQLFIHIHKTVPDVVWGDEQRIRQILINLIGNAVKFTEHGEIHVIVDAVKHRSRYGVRFLVRDTGIGISTESIEHLFQVFTQADVSISRKFGGTGLGLAICQQLVNLMGGAINVSSRLGEGSAFEFTVELPGEFTADSSTVKLQSGLRVIVVDGSRASCEVLQYYLQEWHCHVCLAYSVNQAIDIIKQDSTPFDLMLLDAELLQEDFGGRTDLHAIPNIILLTDSYYRKPLQLPMDLNANTTVLLNKPVLRTSLLHAIRSSFQACSEQKTIVGTDDQVTSNKLSQDYIQFFRDLDALLLENAYIDSELLNKIDCLAGDGNESRQYKALLDCLMAYDYPKARDMLSDIINSLPGDTA
ncbi:histidine kinase [Candidatus Methylobacter oryzae]|uniref:histidine kinase n=1 Tax=Candidatus Methylobacter oryzae TaxID=2497749 RepID=A0ABY3C535_9GAMM|nr:histidine kinase [Candidatus Methylobacter oryzae]